MRKIIELLGVQEHRDRQDNIYYRTQAMVDDGTVCFGFGNDYEIGDEVEVFFHEKYGVIKMRKPIDKPPTL